MGLKSIDSISKYTYTQSLMEKFAYEKRAVLSEQNRIIIDLASFYQVSLTEKIDLIKQVINNRELIKFQYYSEKGESERTIEPYFIIFRWSAWYTNRNFLLQWIQSYGDAVKVIEPLDLVDEVCLNAKKGRNSL